ncbi:MAG TPA: CocE/NonD family hydrolase [Candidatus Binatia bacterium]|nr:CocE/NonD family hydrolase [Candidatus Binatia bacterium]
MNWKQRLLLGAGFSALAVVAMRRPLIARWLDLPPAEYGVKVRRNLRVPMSDDVMLATDHYAPRALAAPAGFPTILIRTPYGRALAPAFDVRRFAERGYHVVVQDVRGRFASGGEFEPFINEARDGAATVAWLQKQPWFNGILGTWGQSYVAYTQWAAAMAAPDAVGALVPSLPSSRGPFSAQVDEAQLLELPLRWMLILDALRHLPGGQGSLSPWQAIYRLSPRGQDRTLADAFAHVPLAECDEVAIGQEVPYFRQMLSGSPPKEWRKADFSEGLGGLQAPVHLIGGWYDFMLNDMLDDYGTLREAGRQPFLTVGPWYHVHPAVGRVALREGLAWFDAHLKGDWARLRSNTVNVYLMGAEEWRQFDAWPPPAQPTSLYLHSGSALSRQAPAEKTEPDTYIYDPADPTPAVGGALFFSGAGPRDNRALEARADVRTFTSAVLERDVDVIGPVKALLHLASTREHTDFFARLCDVHPDGRSINICDGIVRLHPGRTTTADKGVLRVEISMAATAHRFRRGHAIRLQVSSGAHPRFAPNPGVVGPPSSPDDLYSAKQTVYHDVNYPSALVLPLVAGGF